MRAAGIILLICGIAATLAFGMRALTNTEGTQVLGMEVTSGTANWAPVFMGVVLIVAGIIFINVGRKKKLQ